MIYILLPAFNEEKTLPLLLESIRNNMQDFGPEYQVILVDDGSTDATVGVANKVAVSMPLSVICHSENRGLSETLKTSLLEAVSLAKPEDIIVTMDSDNTHTPGLIMRMVRMLREGYDVVIASRYQKESRVIGVPPSRRFLSFGANLLFRMLFPIAGVKDYTCGFRAYRAHVLKQMFNEYGEEFINAPGFSCMVDILIKMRKYPLIIGEASLILRYDLKESASKMKVRRTIKDTLKLIGKRFFNSY
jgi:dolichol-phosphate mannosyltransferase